MSIQIQKTTAINNGYTQMAKKVFISQSNYIPWKGYFDSIAFVDEFILYDDMQFTRQDWRNRNVIKTPSGLKWLSIPVEMKNRLEKRIRDVKVADKITFPRDII